jgi:hypothetical protein
VGVDRCGEWAKAAPAGAALQIGEYARVRLLLADVGLGRINRGRGLARRALIAGGMGQSGACGRRTPNREYHPGEALPRLRRLDAAGNGPKRHPRAPHSKLGNTLGRRFYPLTLARGGGIGADYLGNGDWRGGR